MEANHPSGCYCEPVSGVVFGRRGRPIGAPNVAGYLTYRMTSKRETHYLHRMMWEAVVGPIPKGLDINHKNGIKSDNRIENLEVVTRSQNISHAYMTGLNRGNRKLTDEKAREVVATSETITGREWSRRLNVSESTISEIRTKKRYG